MGLVQNGSAILPAMNSEAITAVGKNLDGSVFIELRGAKGHLRVQYTPGQAFDIAHKIMECLGYRLDAPRPPV